MPQVGFFTDISSPNRGFLESGAAFCFRPINHLTIERRYEILNGVIDKDLPGQPFTWINIAAAIALVIPGLIIGIALKFMAYIVDGSGIRERQAIVNRYLEEAYDKRLINDYTHAIHPLYSHREDHVQAVQQHGIQLKDKINIKIPKPDEGKSFIDYHKEFLPIQKLISSHRIPLYAGYVLAHKEVFDQKSQAFWKRRDIVAAVDKGMEIMVKAMQALKRELKEKENAGTYLSKQNFASDHPYWPFSSFLNFYNMVRGHVYTVNDTFEPFKGICSHIAYQAGGKAKPTNRFETPWLTPGTPQYKWRQYFNFFLQEFSDIARTMDESRFVSRMLPDEPPRPFVSSTFIDPNMDRFFKKHYSASRNCR